MFNLSKTSRLDALYVTGILFLIVISIIILRSIQPSIFPGYFFLIVLGLMFFYIFSFIDFDIISLFSKHFYIGSIVLLVLTLILGNVTRGVVRWIPLGTLTLQASEITKPFLLIFFANYIYKEKMNNKGIFKLLLLMTIPLGLILLQPSLGVAFLLGIGFLGIILSSNISKKSLFFILASIAIIIPVFWYFLAPYQKSRLSSFVNPSNDPLGKGYNSIQSVVAVGDGGLFGRGLGKGIQTQLSFLPEKHTDFVFAAVSEELGLVGAGLTLIAVFLVLWRLTSFMVKSKSPEARAYLSGLFLMLLLQVFVHVGMNIGLLPITGVPFPLVSAGGSSLLSTMIGLGIALGTRKR